jgi:Mg2+/Co2+ transporter CorB
MQAPTSAEIRTAIQVLKRFGEHINHNTANIIIDLPETRLGDHVATRAKVVSIEQVTRIQTVAAQLEKWRDDLLQQRRQCVSHHV